MDNLNISNNNFNDNDNICNSNFATRDKAASTSSKIIIACLTNEITHVHYTSQNEVYLLPALDVLHMFEKQFRNCIKGLTSTKLLNSTNMVTVPSDHSQKDIHRKATY